MADRGGGSGNIERNGTAAAGREASGGGGRQPAASPWPGDGRLSVQEHGTFSCNGEPAPRDRNTSAATGRVIAETEERKGSHRLRIPASRDNPRRAVPRILSVRPGEHHGLNGPELHWPVRESAVVRRPAEHRRK
ncbi:hypothetical protein GCM10010327_32400 [Streptomyces nitrosporeus]|nr:hypothetical protein GCM10010327_32400 [Streptomyces nitrosporeus]